MRFDFKTYNRNTLGGMLIHLAIAGGGLMVLLTLYFYVYLPIGTNKDESVTVPDVQGLTIQKGKEFLTNHDLRFEVNDSTYSPNHPPFTVLKQFPAPGSKVKANRIIFASVNRVKPPTVPM